MKPKKIKLKKVTISNLNSRDLNTIKAGGDHTVASCSITVINCLTNETCTVLPLCECSLLCTKTCITIP